MSVKTDWVFTDNPLNDPCAAPKTLYRVDKTKDVKKHLRTADLFDAEFCDLANRRYKDCNITEYQKRYKREKDFMATFLRQKISAPWQQLL